MSKTTNEFSPEVRERSVRLVFETDGQHASRWQAVMSMAAKIVCAPQSPKGGQCPTGRPSRGRLLKDAGSGSDGACEGFSAAGRWPGPAGASGHGGWGRQGRPR